MKNSHLVWIFEKVGWKLGLEATRGDQIDRFAFLGELKKRLLLFSRGQTNAIIFLNHFLEAVHNR